MDVKELLQELCESECIGCLDGAVAVAEKYLSEIASTERVGRNLVARLGKGGKTVLLDAHIDEIGFMVTSVNDGFVKVAPAGGIDRRMLPAMRVKIHGKETVTGVFCSIPPHLAKKDAPVPAIDELYIDTGLGKRAEEIIFPGDRITFDRSFACLQGDTVTGKALDNRAGVAALIRCAEILHGKALPCSVVLLFSDMEEIGGDGAKIGAFALEPDEAVIVDVSFGNSPDIPPEKSGKLGGGAMVGISPVLSPKVTERLKQAAESLNAAYQTEVMGGKTSTNADDVAASKAGVPCGLLSIPLRNMHTPAELVDSSDIESAAQILAQYILLQEERL